ncbi:MAG: hypothetical protein WCG83_05655 [Candidatus Peregrinibacteria bacterium]
MRIKELYDAIEMAHVKLSMKGQGGIMANHYSLPRPVYIESLLKHRALPSHFGETFDGIMRKEYGTEDAKATIRFSEFGRSQPDVALLMERSLIQFQTINSLLDDATDWIKSSFPSFRHQGNLEAFGKNFKEFFEKNGETEYGWHRIVLALKTFFDEKLLPTYPRFPQLKQRCESLSSLLDADSPPSTDQERSELAKTLLKQMDDLQWYFDNFCYGSESVVESEEHPLSAIPAESNEHSRNQEVVAHAENKIRYAFDGRLKVSPDGAVYVDDDLTDAVPCVGQTLYAILSKEVGYVSYHDIARAIYGEEATEPKTGRKGAIRRYVSTLRSLLSRYFPDCRIESERGKGWTFAEHVK